MAFVVDPVLSREGETVMAQGVGAEKAIPNHGVLKRRLGEAVRSSSRFDRVWQNFVVGEVRWDEMGRKIQADSSGKEVLWSSLVQQ